MFLDQATITVKGGNGGRGCVGFRREKFIPHGGPDGGNGGKGGDVVLLADDNTDTLSDFASRKKFEAEKGRFGMGKNRAGNEGDDLVLLVPPGTTFTDAATNKRTALRGELLRHGECALVARGGKGGFGNAHFKSSTRQAPDFAELGEPGEERILELELKLVADVGIIGYPSVGKSTIISVISAARPKIADYPFTTLVPNLGVVTVSGRSYVVCDVPGLIEGASEGKGLGHEFLRHIERCGVLLHVLDVGRALEGTSVDVEKLHADYLAIRRELSAHSPALAEKRELIVLNKSDLVAHETKQIEKECLAKGMEIVLSISAATNRNIPELMKKLLPIVLEERTKRQRQTQERAETSIPVLRPLQENATMGAYRIERTDNAIRVHGKRIEQFTQMTDFGNDSAVRRFKNVLERTGILQGIRKARKDAAIPVFIGTVRVDEYL